MKGRKVVLCPTDQYVLKLLQERDVYSTQSSLNFKSSFVSVVLRAFENLERVIALSTRRVARK